MRTLLGVACLVGSWAMVWMPAAQTIAAQPETHAEPSSAPIAFERGYVDGLKTLVARSYISQPGSETPALVLHIAPVKVEGLSDCLLVELARVDSPLDPFRVYILQIGPRRGNVNLRTFEFPTASGMKDAMAGLWAAASSIPPIDGSALTPTMDLPVVDASTPGRPAFAARTEHSFPVNRQGAVEMTASVRQTARGLQLSDAGIDAEGNKVWASDIEFTRSPLEPTVRREDNGLVIITSAIPRSDAPRHTPGGELSLSFTSWTAAGVKVQSSRDPGHEPIRVRVPGAPLPALDTALSGMAKGERRKIVIPAALAYGERGRGVVPPNMTLIYDVECIGVNNSPAAPARTPMPSADPHPHAPPPPPPAKDDGPIGTPPTNPDPETPR